MLEAHIQDGISGDWSVFSTFRGGGRRGLRLSRLGGRDEARGGETMTTWHETRKLSIAHAPRCGTFWWKLTVELVTTSTGVHYLHVNFDQTLITRHF
jgi:hypothetical protein